jgi:NAD+ kinase
MAAYKVPVIGINAGRLGFITDIVLEDMNRLLPAMLLGQYVADERSMLEGSVWREGNMLFEGLAVNDIGISHGRALGMVEYTVYVDGLQMAVQRADGVLVSTSTGSTAYAMAAGGPIMHPSVSSMLLVPIAPHTLSNRPIVLGSHTKIDIEVNETRSAVASFDAQVLIDVQAGDVLRVKVSKERFTMLHPVGYNHFDLLRRKLKWNYLPQSEHPIHTPLQDQTTPVQIPHPTTSEKSSD